MMKESKTSILGTDALFENYTIEEIQEIEKKTKIEIEKKKEELRQMVGERYRDLIEAADTIQAMRSSATNISSCISQMVSVCENLPNRLQNVSIKNQKAEQLTNLQYYEIGAQIKLLLDIPKNIWTHIDNKNFLCAAKLYLLARHIHSSLQVSPLQGMSIHKNFPIINRQWSAISHFRAQILEGCHKVLKEADLDEQQMADNLVTLMLLEGTTPRQVFNQFLLARTKSLQDMFSSDKDGMVAKDQICGVVRLILDTVCLVHVLFYNPENSDNESAKRLLSVTLCNTISSESNSPLNLVNLDSPVMKYLPATIKDFRPSCIATVVNVTESEIQTTSFEWIDTVSKEVTKGFVRILGYINSIKSLSLIRNSVWKLLNDDNHKESWLHICNDVFKKPFDIWKEFIHPVFLKEIEKIISAHLDGAVNFSSQAVERILSDGSDHDYDLSEFVWSRNVSDGINKRNWLNSSNRVLCECSQLTMKANGFIPLVQRLCAGLNGRLRALLDDFKFYVIPDDDSTNTKNSLDLAHYSPNCLPDNEYLFNYLQDKTEKCINKLLEYFEENFQNNDNGVIRNLQKYALLARFPVGIVQLCPQLQLCFNFTTCFSDSSLMFTAKRINKTDSKEKSKWGETKNKLKLISQRSYKLWCDTIVKELHEKFKKSCEELNSFSITYQPIWHEIEIHEENEAGMTLKSKIKVPGQISRNLLNILVDLSTVINQVAGHIMNKSNINETVVSLSSRIVDTYGAMVLSEFKQNQALQLLFDLKFLATLFIPKENSKIQPLIEKVENCIDPFDLDVFSPHIQSNLKRYIQSSMILLGLIIPSDKHALFGGKRISSIPDQHNVLPITTSTNSFILLPVSDAEEIKSTVSGSSMKRLSFKEKKDEKARSASPSPSRKRSLPSASGMGHKSQSFYDRMTAMSNSWFGSQ